jgi:hypothetical protein
VARWLAVALLGFIACALVIEASTGRLLAQPGGDAGPAGRGDGVIAVVGQITDERYALFLVDTRRQRIAMYQWLPKKGRPGVLRYLASRYYGFDIRMDSYNTEMDPREVRKLLEGSTRLEATESP